MFVGVGFHFLTLVSVGTTTLFVVLSTVRVLVIIDRVEVALVAADVLIMHGSTSNGNRLVSHQRWSCEHFLY